MKTHEEARSEAYVLVIAGWKDLAEQARAQGLTALAEAAEAQALALAQAS